MNVVYLIKAFIWRIIHPRGNTNNIKTYCSVHPSAILHNFSIRTDKPYKGRKYVEIGKNSIVSGTYIFESEEGHVSIGEHSYIGGGTFISRSNIEIGNHVTIAWGGTIYDHDSHSMNYWDRRKDIDDELNDIRNGRNFIEHKDWSNVRTKPIKICDDAWIGMNVIILKGVTIGEGAVVGAGSVVTKDVPAWTVVAGNPAKEIRRLSNGNKSGKANTI